mmetsp:Transcript_28155/g.32423  ORF Transcript_28155/g.32423 Transcript_28155/m.32423 type:complete len:87 (-) Transcript_28155:381-641(-)|eukprot:CAMPEP_0171313906 /NCGR_PEP_ID=MMETSP0816-20121228/46843_1 /TAXON_ID=420281 /ORGANISM="Proboscia inermis, Strain CCAP1064/1" /LENGTH=86 /DNA_ID=CAMNT_0011802047 /DNA_START=65 /DNA_END=325 /DNA_ORIENTATION=+
MDAEALQNLTPDQKQQIMAAAAQQAQQQIMGQMLEKMSEQCFKKCAGTSGDRLDNKEQSCMANCQDRFFDTRQQVQEALQKRQNSM